MSDATMPRPTTDDRDEWKAYWTAQGEPWRTEPEISPERQTELGNRYKIFADIEKGIFPFKDVRLSRADIEWLLHKHGPRYWSSMARINTDGLDLRGALLNKTETVSAPNLSNLPLAKCLFGRSFYGSFRSNVEQQLQACANMEGVNLETAQLQGAILRHVHLEGANLGGAFLTEADLSDAHLEGADFFAAQMYRVDLRGAHLEGASLQSVHFVKLFEDAPGDENEQPGLMWPERQSADLRLAFFDTATAFNDAIIGNSSHQVRLADVHWGGANLAIIPWKEQVGSILGDEVEARRIRNLGNGKVTKEIWERITDWESAVRAYRQLTVALRSQGMNEIADRFAYRAQLCQRRVTRFGGLRSLPSYLGSLLLDLVSGYGFRPARSLATYALVIGMFALIYGLLGQSSHPLTIQESIVVSMTAFHGRGFFATSFSPGDPQAIAAAVEAFVGLFIEVTFIATFTQRFFSR